MPGFIDRSSLEGSPLANDDVETSPAKRLERNTPILEDVVPLALAARQRGEDTFDVEMTAKGRPWETRVAVKGRFLGVWGRVVARMRSAPRGAAAIDTGEVSRLLVRFGVIEVLDVHRREEILRLTPRPVLGINRPRQRPRNVMIR